METMTISTRMWLSLPSYGTGPSVEHVASSLHGVSGTPVLCAGADALVLTGQPGTGVVRDANAFGFATRIKDARPGSRAWSPPV